MGYLFLTFRYSSPVRPSGTAVYQRKQQRLTVCEFSSARVAHVLGPRVAVQAPPNLVDRDDVLALIDDAVRMAAAQDEPTVGGEATVGAEGEIIGRAS